MRHRGRVEGIVLTEDCLREPEERGEAMAALAIQAQNPARRLVTDARELGEHQRVQRGLVVHCRLRPGHAGAPRAWSVVGVW